MKRVGITLLLVLAASLSYGQTKNASTALNDGSDKSMAIEGLSNDDDFKRYLNNANALISGIKDIKALNEIVISEKEDEASVEAMSQQFGLKSGKAFKAYVKKQNELITILDKRYNFSQYQQKALLNHLELAINTIGINDVPVAASNCWQIYQNQLVQNMAAAVVGHIACAGTADLTLVLGAGCHAAVAAIQVTANNNAYYNYQNCL